MILNELFNLSELSPGTLASYKKKAGADASAADAAGDYARGNKRFKGIVKATKKQFANDTKVVAEGAAKFDPKTGLPVGQQISEFGGDATEFMPPTQSTPTTEQPPRRGYSIMLTGKPGRDWMAEYAWQALEAVFPREYPGDSSVSNYSGDKTVTPAMQKVLQAHNGPVVVKTGITSEDIAETLVAKLAANRVPAQYWRITSEDLDEGVTEGVNDRGFFNNVEQWHEAKSDIEHDDQWETPKYIVVKNNGKTVAKWSKADSYGWVDSSQQGVAKNSLDEVSDTTLTNYLTKVDADSRKHKMDPTRRSPEKRSKSVTGFAKASNKIDSRKEQGVAEDSPRQLPKRYQNAIDDFDRFMDDPESTYKDELQSRHDQTKKRIQTKPMAGPKGQLPEQGVAEGSVNGEYGRVLDALQLYYPRLSMEELNVPGYHKVVANKANVPVEYAAQVINDFVRDNDPDEDEFSNFNDDEQSVAEDYNGEYDDEAGMADNNLETLKRAVEGIDDVISAGDNLPEWCQEKIAVSKSMLVSVWDYMRSEEESEIAEGNELQSMLSSAGLGRNR